MARAGFKVKCTPTRTVVLVACVKTKADRPSPARDLYISPWFRKARAWAEAHGDTWYILSAKHDFLATDKVVAPYEETLVGASAARLRDWGRRTAGQILERFPQPRRFILLAGVSYRRHLVPLLEAAGHSIEVPMEGLPLGHQLRWLGREIIHTSPHPDLDRFYDLLDELGSRPGQGQPLSAYTGYSGLPKRGVYFFFEPGETRPGHAGKLRVVRVGTHAVSKGSKSTLWGRLRSHRGAGHGGGNHRGSVFRKIVGEALLKRQELKLASWGRGNNAPRNVRQAEQWLEKQVSAHIGQMPICWVEIGDEPSKDSKRALVEKGSISLLSEVAKNNNPAQPDWLGLHSPRKPVSSSGLWNVQHVGSSAPSDWLKDFTILINRS